MRQIAENDYGFNEYQNNANVTVAYPNVGANIIYPALGMAGEAGEVAEKVKKLWRNNGIMSGKNLNIEQKSQLVKEMGDVLWYIAALAKEIDVEMSEIARMNVDKVNDRLQRNAIKSEGDNR